MLAAQMAAVHVTFMKFAQHFHRVETLAQQDSAERAFNKLARTFTTQMEALKLSDRRRAEGHGAARLGRRGWASNRRQRDTGHAAGGVKTGVRHTARSYRRAATCNANH
jgi:hypothetical protein